MKTFFKKTALTLFCGLMALSTPMISRAAEVSLGLPIVSSYVWRGQELNKEAVFQPSLSVPLGYNIGFNFWGNMDLTNINKRSGEFTEIDLTLDYSKSFGPLTADVGIISYMFPGVAAVGAPGPASSTHELFLSLSADVIASPSLAVYSDVDEIKGSYFLLGLSHSFDIKAGPLNSLDLSASAGYGSASYNRGYFGLDKAAPVDLVLGLSLPFTFGTVGLTPAVSYSYLLDNEISTSLDKTGYVYFSLGASLSL